MNLLLPSCKEEIGEAFLLSESKDNALNWKTPYLKVQTFYLFFGQLFPIPEPLKLNSLIVRYKALWGASGGSDQHVFRCDGTEDGKAYIEAFH